MCVGGSFAHVIQESLVVVFEMSQLIVELKPSVTQGSLKNACDLETKISERKGNCQYSSTNLPELTPALPGLKMHQESSHLSQLSLDFGNLGIRASRVSWSVREEEVPHSQYQQGQVRSS